MHSILIFFFALAGRKYHLPSRRPIRKVVIPASLGRKIVYTPREVKKNASDRMFTTLGFASGTTFGQEFSQNSPPVVHSHLGNIEGYYKTSFNGRKYAVYEGIPYALPPTGPRRFQPAEPQEWVGNFTATKLANKCVQYTKRYTVEGDEDCLYLNIYLPVQSSSKSLPVLFTIPGGCYQYGAAYSGVEFLMDRDVIVVAINYRVGILGFLSTEDHIIPGNMGLKDQSLALQWVSKNIHYFGGDPKRITLIGVSAGSASVHYHYLSPMSKGLFQNGLSFSGTAFDPAKQTENSREKAYKLASILGCPTEDIHEMVECLRYKPARTVVESTKYFMPWLYNPFTPFGPVVEKYGDNPFVDRSPIEIISSGDAADVLWITGVNNAEGISPTTNYVDNDEYLEDLDKNWEAIAPHLLDYNFTIPLEQHAELARKIRKYYFGDKPIDKRTAKELINCIGDRHYNAHIETSAKIQAKMNKSPVLLWYYSYQTRSGGSEKSTHNKKNYGAGHAENFLMIYHEISTIYPPKSKEDTAMQIKLIDFVVSVAEKGYPEMGLDFEWKKVDPNQETLDYLHFIDPDNIRMESNDDFAQKRFWNSIDFDENKLRT